MNQYPAYIKVPQILLGLILFFYILYIGQEILIPLTFALIFSILLNPLSNFMQRFGVGRVLSIILSVLIFMIVIGGILFFVGAQVARFQEAVPELQSRFEQLFHDTVDWVCNRFNIPKSEVDEWIQVKKKEGLEEVGGQIGSTLVTIGGIAVMALLIPVYIFLFLFYKPLILEFIARVFTSDKHGTLSDILASTRTILQSYLIGIMIELVIVTTAYTTVLLIIGIPYALVIACVGALLNLIPYVGGLIAVCFAMLMALLTSAPVTALYVLGGYITVQAIDNNFLVPVIVASKVKVNALISIISVLFWGALWGVAGMFLSIPLTAMFKVVFDKVKPLKPYGLLLGDTMPPIGKKMFRLPAFNKPSGENPPEQPGSGPVA
jgi:predicted PurR-regulated permease PerM